LWGLTYSQVFPLINKIANLGNVVIPDLWNLNPYLAVIAFDLMALFLFYLIERAGLQRKEKLQ
jgi:arginase family enzyme